MRVLGPIFAFILVCCLCPISVASAQDCKCSGHPMGAPFAGGNGQPLKWTYSPYLLNSPPPTGQKLICYFKQVDNRGNADVRDVRWEVANFYRKIVPRGGATTSCPQVAGDTKQAPSNGPLNYGPSSDAYDTTVLQPKDGWGEAASGAPASQPLVTADGRRFQPFSGAGLSFFVETQDKTLPVYLAVQSEISPSSNTISYIVQNDSEARFGVLVNLSATSEARKNVPMLQNILWLKPHDKFLFSANPEGQRSIEQAAVVVYDESRKIIAIDSAAFYTVVGQKEVTDRSFWERLR